MGRIISACLSVALVGMVCLHDTKAAGPQKPRSIEAAASPQRELVDRYCVTCHNDQRRTAGLALDRANLQHVSESAEVWEKVLRKLRAGEMPPPGMPAPDKTSVDAFVSWLETSLDRGAAANPDPGRPAIHRLNRTEYANVIRDLLALDVNSRDLLTGDDSAYGFDNIADLLSVSPGLLERYMSAAKKISRLAIGDPDIRPMVTTYDVPRFLVQGDRVSEDLPFASRGGMAIHHRFPLDGEYEIKLTLRGQPAGGDQIDVRIDGVRVKLFAVGTGASDGYQVDAQAAAQFAGQRGEGGPLKVRFPTKAGTALIGIALVKRPSVETEGLRPARLPATTNSAYAEPGLGSVEIAGPYNARGAGDTPSRNRIFVCRPRNTSEEEPCARTILSALARHAYRRPVNDGDLQPLMGFYSDARGEGDFEAGIERALQRLLVDPDFLFRIEQDPAKVLPDTAYRISDIELASRLSFFLWSSIPDEHLLRLAERGKLRDPTVLEQQVRRMLSDDRSISLISNFATQWLYLRNLRVAAPDPNTFPEFDDNLRDAFQRETDLFLESQIREDHPLSDLLNANYTFVNERLARHYGIPNVHGSQFRRVTLSDDTRGGLLGQGSILTVTSYANRTSPVVRGKWLLENLLGTPPPPPPPNVPALREKGEGNADLGTMRQQMEEHRKNPACAGCHARMDPLGFALENYDAIGRWRTADAGVPIDTSGALPDGTRFQGPAGLRKLLVDRRVEFAKTLTAKLLTYATGRGAEYFDAPVIRAIVRDAAPNDYRWSAIILGIVKSTSFQMRRSQS